MSNLQMNWEVRMPAFAGIHLSGSNAPKTAVVILRHSPNSFSLNLSKVYEKIGSFGNLFSDDRLIGILGHVSPLNGVFVDCPLSAPPCVECRRPVCPGVVRCEDVSVGFMSSMAALQKRSGARRVRPLNPQSQRLWDVLQVYSMGSDRSEPSFSANLAPLVIRAQTLQRRLNAERPELRLRETQISAALQALAPVLALAPEIRVKYRNFEVGLETREEIAEALLATEILDTKSDPTMIDTCVSSVETFHALIAAVVAGLYARGLTSQPTEAFVEGAGWVYLPEFSPLALATPRGDLS